MNTVQLQGIGKVEGIEVKDLKVGDTMVWNYGYTSKVVAIEASKTGKTFNVTTEYMDSLKKELVQGVRKMKGTRLVAIQKTK